MDAARIVFEPSRPPQAVAIPAPHVASGRFGWGAAVDVGTTTLAVRAFDLGTGKPLGEASALNPQADFGHDVLSRVSEALAGQAYAMRDAVGRQVERLVTKAGGGGADDPTVVVVVGNPTMLHLLLGRDVTPLSAVPYAGALTEPLAMTADEAGLPALGDAVVRTGPGVSAFVGADAVAGFVATGMAEGDGRSVLVDLGTNGEIMLAGPDGLVAASAAAGPALEGVSIECGMRAETGAIDSAKFEFGVLALTTIDNVPARGICGSGLLDLGAALLAAGAIDPSGRMNISSALAAHFSVDDRGARLGLADGVHLTQHDIRQLQLAKGAIATAIAMVLEEAGVEAVEVDRVIVGGGFGSHVDPESLAAIGMIPREWVGRVEFGGNTALAGAVAMLLDPAVLARATALSQRVRTVPLAARADFQMRFLDALDLPELRPHSG